MNAALKNISYYLPENVLTNEKLSNEFSFLTPEEIYKRSGVRKRHITYKGILGSDLAYCAAIRLFEEYALDKQSIDFLLLCTTALDYKVPATSSILQDRLKLPKNIGTMDIPMGCTGFVYGLSFAKGLIASGQATKVLLLTAEVPSIVCHPEDYALRMIFGDAGAAAVIEADTKNEIGEFVFGSDGSGAMDLHVERSFTRHPVDASWLEEYNEVGGMKYGRMKMDGSAIFSFALRVVPSLVNDILDKNDVAFEDVDLFIFHQPNGYLLNVIKRKLQIPDDKFFSYMEEVGNTVSCTIPIALREAENQGKIKVGDTILVAGFGTGLSWAGTILKK